MGQEKLMLPVDGRPMIQKIAETVSKSLADESILIYRRIEVMEAALDYVTKSAHNPKASVGQSEAIRLGLRYVHPECLACLFVMGDQPRITVNLINKLIEAGKKNPDRIIVPVYDKQTGSPVLFPVEFWPELQSLSGDEGGRKVIQSHPDRILKVVINDESAWMDADTWEDYEKIIKKGRSRQ